MTSLSEPIGLCSGTSFDSLVFQNIRTEAMMLYLWSFAIGLIHIPAYSFDWPIWLLLFLVILSYSVSKIKFTRFFLCVTCIWLGMAWGSWALQRLCASQLNEQFDGRVYPITFTITSIPKVNPTSSIFTAKVESVLCEKDCPELVGKTVRLSWYRSHQHVKEGQIWSANVRLKRPRSVYNPGTFDYHAWLLSQEVAATGYIVKKAELKGEKFVWAKWRSNLEKILTDRTDSPYKRFWGALLIGEQTSITSEDWRTFQHTGTVHLFVVSGMHIGLIAGWCYLIGLALCRFLALFHLHSNRIIIQLLPPLLACAGAGVYAALAGLSIPTIRALVTCIAIMFCRIFAVHISGFSLLACAVIIVGLNEPLAWVNAGFWLSFLAVGCLLYMFSGRIKNRFFDVFWRTQPLLALGLIFPLLLIGQGVSLMGPFANLIVVPVVSFLLIPSLILAALSIFVVPAASDFLLSLSHWIFHIVWVFLQYLTQLPFNMWWPSREISLLHLILGAVGTLLFLSPVGLMFRHIGAIWLFLALFGRTEKDFIFRIHVVDVGQGQAVILQTPQETWLYDTGPGFTDQFNAGSHIVAPYLRKLGIRELNVIVSHADLDHSGGTDSVLRAFNVNRLMLGEELHLQYLQESTQVEPCHSGQSWEAGSVSFQVIWPTLESSYSGNNASCVVQVSFQGAEGPVHMLLPGDIDRATEQRLLPNMTSVDWLLAPHHGSHSSSSYRMLLRTQPKHVVFSTGYRNRYGHPHEKILKRYTEIGAKTYNTATDGALTFTWDENGLHISRARTDYPKLWHKAH